MAGLVGQMVDLRYSGMRAIGPICFLWHSSYNTARAFRYKSYASPSFIRTPEPLFINKNYHHIRICVYIECSLLIGQYYIELIKRWLREQPSIEIEDTLRNKNHFSLQCHKGPEYLDFTLHIFGDSHY